MRIFITGGAGFIGSRLARSLRANHEVCVFDSFLSQVHEGNPQPAGWMDGITIVRGDVRDADALTRAVQSFRPEIIYHLAAETGTGQSYDEPVRYTAVNVMGTCHLIEAVRACGGVGRIVLAGSRSVYGEGACVNDLGQPTAAAERTGADMQAGRFEPHSTAGAALRPVPTNAQCPVAPASIYASTKLMQEYLLKQAFWGTDTQVGILRLQNVFGPGQSLNNPYTGVISIFCKQISQGKVLNIFEDGEITRDFVLVDDVVDAFHRIGTLPMDAGAFPDEIIDIGSGVPTTILSMARLLLTLMGQDASRYQITGAYRAGDIRYAVADISAARRHLDWTPRHSFEQGLQQFLDWSSKIA